MISQSNFFSMAYLPKSIKSIEFSFRFMAMNRYKYRNKERQGLGTHYLCHEAFMHTTSIHPYLHCPLLPKEPCNTDYHDRSRNRKLFLSRLSPRTRSSKRIGKSWFFFGEQDQATDYYYKSYLEFLKKEK